MVESNRMTKTDKMTNATDVANVKHVRDLLHRKDFTPAMLQESDFKSSFHSPVRFPIELGV